jgi:hypothetical protein
METILSHPLGPLPWSLATPDGLLRKTNKATLATVLQKDTGHAEHVPPHSALVVGSMGLVQRVKGDERSFGDVSNTILSMALAGGGDSDRIDVVFDTYQENSIKNCERLARGAETGHHLQSISAKQIVRKWRMFLTTIRNKSSLITFLVQEWMKEENRQKLQDKILYVTDGAKCYMMTSQDSKEVPELQCQQEEADGRLLLHAKHAAQDGYQSAIIASEDTDVFIMSLACSDRIGVPLYQKCGNRTRTRLVDIMKISAIIGINVCRALIGMHAYTGCDSVSAFAGKGKASSLKLMIQNRELQDMFFELGQTWSVSSELMTKLEEFTCLLYAPKASAVSVDQLRYDLFCAKRGEVESHQLPPCKDCLKKHAKRANYQAAVWRRCLDQDPNVPSPVGHGWKMEVDNGQPQLVIDWMDGQPAPEAVLDLLACNCERICTLLQCACLLNGMRCTDMCKLPDCGNQAPIESDEDTDDELDEEMEDGDF